MGCLAAVSLLAAALPAGAAADVPLGPPITVPLDGTKAYSSPLVAGGVYRIVATGTATQTATNPASTVEYDALYCFRYVPAFAFCSQSNPLRRSNVIVVHYEGDPSLYDLDGLNQGTQLPYDGVSHRYEETFTAARSGRLEVFFNGCLTCYTQQGTIALQLHLVSLPAPPAPGPPGGGPPGADKPPTIVSSTKWGKPGPATALGPGDEAIALGPQIASGQTQASVTVSGDAAPETAIVIGTPRRRPGGKLTGGDCIRATLAIAKRALPDRNIDGSYDEQKADAATLFTILFLSACLEYVRELDKQANPAAPRSAVGAARLSCGVRTASLSVRVDRAAKKISYRSRRASRRGPARRLRVSCRQAGNGTVTMRVRTRSRRTKLRKVLGKQLVVGLYRPRAATGTANVQTTFKRR